MDLRNLGCHQTFNVTVPNVNYALYEFVHWLRVAGEEEDSRNGKVLVSPGPVCTLYQNPRQRVLFNPWRDANPFFHFFESLWMLAGSDEVAYLAQFNKRMATYSDGGKTLHGAYGHRWRAHFAFDQLQDVVNMLRETPTSRRAVLTMWDPNADSNCNSKDLPCNTHIYFDLRHGCLNMTVCNRSNDMLWGAYGANAVHFSVLQEYIANRLRVPVGLYYQFSNNAHIYLETAGDPRKEISEICAGYDYYMQLDLQPYPHILSPEDRLGDWEDDLFDLIARGNKNWSPRTKFFAEVACPMLSVWEHRREHELLVTGLVNQIKADDWRTAASQWLARRALGKGEKNAAAY